MNLGMGMRVGRRQVNLRLRILAENDGHVITSVITYYSKVIDYEQLGGEGDRTPVSYAYGPARSRKDFIREDSKRVSRHGNAWMALDVISFVIGWPAFGDIRNRSIGQLVSVMKMGGSAGS